MWDNPGTNPANLEGKTEAMITRIRYWLPTVTESQNFTADSISALIEHACHRAHIKCTLMPDGATMIEGRDKAMNKCQLRLDVTNEAVILSTDNPRMMTLATKFLDPLEYELRAISDHGYNEAYGQCDQHKIREDVLDIIGKDERIISVVRSWEGRSPGRLVGTSERVIFASVSPFLGNVCVQVIRLEDISSMGVGRENFSASNVILHASHTEIKATCSHKDAAAFQQSMREPIDNAKLAASMPGPQTSATVDVAGQLVKLAELHSGGALSDDEFAAAKARVLAGA